MSRTVARRAKPTIRLRWENPSQKTVTLEHIVGNRVAASRTMRGRGLLSLPEAAAVIERPEAFLRAAIRDGELRAGRRGRAPRVSSRAAQRCLHRTGNPPMCVDMTRPASKNLSGS